MSIPKPYDYYLPNTADSDKDIGVFCCKSAPINGPQINKSTDMAIPCNA